MKKETKKNNPEIEEVISSEELAAFEEIEEIEEIVDPESLCDIVEADAPESAALVTVIKSTEIVNPEDDGTSSLISDESLIGVYNEIADDIRRDGKQVDGLIDTFEDMVKNTGDASSSSKEALVNLIKIKTDLADKKIKVADLMTRLKLKEKNTYKPFLNKPGNTNTINIIDQSGGNRRAFLEMLNQQEGEHE